MNNQYVPFLIFLVSGLFIFVIALLWRKHS
jgi:hypothetical protein